MCSDTECIVNLSIQQFKYLYSTMSENGSCKEEVGRRGKLHGEEARNVRHRMRLKDGHYA